MDALVVLFGNGKFISLMDLWHLVAQRRVTNGSGDVIEWVVPIRLIYWFL